MYQVRDIATAFSKDPRGATVFDMLQDAIDSAELSFKLATLEIELKAIPEYKAYLENHDKNIVKFGRKPDENESAKLRGVESLIDEKCEPDKIVAYNKAESEALNQEIDRDIKKIPHSLFNGQKIRGTLLKMIYPFIDLEK